MDLLDFTPSAAARGSFYRFPLLPPEIRTQIWIYALRVPRHITILTKFHRTSRIMVFDSRHTAYCHVSQNPPPPLVHVSRESRSLAEHYYTRAFNIGSRPRYTYINFFLDTIIMPDYDFRHLYRGEDRKAIRRLVVTVEKTFLLGAWYDRLKPLMFDMPQLESVTGVILKEETPGHPNTYYEDKVRRAFVWENQMCRRRVGWICPVIRFVAEGEVDEDPLRDVKILNRTDALYAASDWMY